jgi:hypothetical protein
VIPNADAIRRSILTYTVPFFGFQDGEMKHQGSGVLLRSADKHFVLSASHVVEPSRNKYKIPMFIGAGPLGSAGIPLVGLRIMAAGDPYDLAVIELSPETSAAIATTHRFLNAAQCEFTRSYHPRQPFLIVGFPAALSENDRDNKRLSIQPFAQVTWLYGSNSQNLPLYEEALHLLFEYPLEGVDFEGKPVALPPPQGISGCGVWRIARPNLSPQEWAPNDFTMVAVEHCLWPDTRALMATRLEHSLSLIRTNHPELEPAFALSLHVSRHA